jgi:septation ring formation regulator EzrA
MKAKHAEKLAALPSAKALVDQRKTVATELGEIEKSQQQLKSSLQDLNKKAQGAEDPQLAALRKQIADSQKLVKDAPQDKRFADDQAKIKKADEALSAKLTQLLAADAGYQAAQKDIEAVETKAKEVDDQIKAAKKPAKREKPAAATKPAATKAAKGVAKAATKPSTKPATT